MNSTANCLNPSPDSIKRTNGSGSNEFERHYRKVGEPVIISDAVRDWPALTKWTPDFFRTRFGSQVVKIDGRSYTLAQVVESAEKSTDSHPSPYLHNWRIHDWVPELLPDLEPKPAYLFPNWLDGPFAWKLYERYDRSRPQVYIGGRGGKFPLLHYDLGHTHAFLNQIYGRKRFLLFPPTDSKYLYPRKDLPNISEIEDLENPDLMRFPLFARTSPRNCVLNPGETIFVPGGWWHATQMLGTSITVSFNTADSSNWSALIKDVCGPVPLIPKLRFGAYLQALRMARLLLRN